MGEREKQEQGGGEWACLRACEACEQASECVFSRQFFFIMSVGEYV